jgi:hypothetical protein
MFMDIDSMRIFGAKEKPTAYGGGNVQLAMPA